MMQKTRRPRGVTFFSRSPLVACKYSPPSSRTRVGKLIAGSRAGGQWPVAAAAAAGRPFMRAGELVELLRERPLVCRRAAPPGRAAAFSRSPTSVAWPESIERHLFIVFDGSASRVATCCARAARGFVTPAAAAAAAMKIRARSDAQPLGLAASRFDCFAADWTVSAGGADLRACPPLQTSLASVLWSRSLNLRVALVMARPGRPAEWRRRQRALLLAADCKQTDEPRLAERPLGIR